VYAVSYALSAQISVAVDMTGRALIVYTIICLLMNIIQPHQFVMFETQTFTSASRLIFCLLLANGDGDDVKLTNLYTSIIYYITLYSIVLYAIYLFILPTDDR